MCYYAHIYYKLEILTSAILLTISWRWAAPVNLDQCTQLQGKGYTHTRTQAACFRTGSSVMPAKHQLEAQIAQRHVQSHAAGSTEHHQQTQGRARRRKTTGCKGTGAEYSGTAHKGQEWGVMLTNTRSCKHYACTHYTILWQSSIRPETGYMHGVSTKTFAAGLRRTGVSRKKVLHCLKSSEVFVVA